MLPSSGAGNGTAGRTGPRYRGRASWSMRNAMVRRWRWLSPQPSARGESGQRLARLGDVPMAESGSMRRPTPTAGRWPGHGARTEQRSVAAPSARATALESAKRGPRPNRRGSRAGDRSGPAADPQFLGYASSERGENLDSAEAMIRQGPAPWRPTTRRSLTRSAGAVQAGALRDAIETLQRAAARDPQQPEIHEHLATRSLNRPEVRSAVCVGMPR